MARQFDRQEPAESNRSPRKPPMRFTMDAHGRKVRLYECPYCRDIGIASLPNYRRDETDEDLVRAGMPRHAYPCPICRNTEVGLSGEPLSDTHKARLQRWRMARRADLDREKAEDKGEVLTFEGALRQARGIVGAVPALSEMEQNEIAARLRRER